MLAIVQVPKHGDTILASGSSERSIGRDSEGVDVTSVAKVVGLELALVELPDLRNQRCPSTTFQSSDSVSEILVDKVVSSGKPSEVANIIDHII